MTLTYRRVKGFQLTPDEADGNMDHLLSSANHTFLQSGTGALTSTVSAALQLLPHSSQYSSAANFNTAVAALTGTQGVSPQMRFGTPTLNSVTTLLRWPTPDTSAGDFVLVLDDDGVVSGVRNNIWCLGYNLAGGQVQEDLTEPAWGWTIESDFNTGSAELMEMHFQGVHTDGTAFRNWTWTVDRSSKFIDHALFLDQITFYDRLQTNFFYQAAANASAVTQKWGADTYTFYAKDATTAYLTIATSTTPKTLRFDGQIGIGVTPNAGRALDVLAPSLTGTQQFGVYCRQTIFSGATNTAAAFNVALSTQAAAFTVPDLIGLFVNNTGKGAGSAITNQYGVFLADLTSGGSNYGVYSAIAAATNTYGLYFTGTAQNYLNGVTGIGIAPSSTAMLTLAAGATGVASLRLPHGSAPSSPVNGDMWTTTSGLFVRINGGTVGPLT